MLPDPVVTTEGAGAEILPATVQPEPDTIVVPTNTGPRVQVVPGDLSDPHRQPEVPFSDPAFGPHQTFTTDFGTHPVPIAVPADPAASHV